MERAWLTRLFLPFHEFEHFIIFFAIVRGCLSFFSSFFVFQPFFGYRERSVIYVFHFNWVYFSMLRKLSNNYKPCERACGHNEDDYTKRHVSNGRMQHVDFAIKKTPILGLINENGIVKVSVEEGRATAAFECGTQVGFLHEELPNLFREHRAAETIEFIFEVSEGESCFNCNLGAFMAECVDVSFVLYMNLVHNSFFR